MSSSSSDLDCDCLLVLAHPNPESFSRALASSLENQAHSYKRSTRLIDLYCDGFDPVLELSELERKNSWDPLVQSYMKSLESARHVCLIGPEWWNAWPSLLSGWLQRVLRPGIAYYHEEDHYEKASGLLGHQHWHLFLTSERPKEAKLEDYYRDQDVAPAWLLELGQSLTETCGIQKAHTYWIPSLRRLAFAKRQAFLTNAGAFLNPE